MFMHNSPGTPFFTCFDYSRGAPSISIIPFPITAASGSDLPSTEFANAFEIDVHHFTESGVPFDVDGNFRFAQAASSGGRMELHKLVIASGQEPRTQWVPLRSSSSALLNGLQRIADGIEPGSHVLDPEIEFRIFAGIRILEEKEGSQIIQIH